MSRKWWGIAAGAGLLAISFVLLGYFLPRQLGFTPHLLAALFAISASTALAILLVEGTGLTREERQRRVVVKAAKLVLTQNEEVGVAMSREFAQSLAVQLYSVVDLYGDERGGDWDKDFKPLLVKVFSEAEEVPAKGIKHPGRLDVGAYKEYLASAKSYSQRMRERIEVNIP